MNTEPKPCTDEELRKMRNAIYPANNQNQVQSDASWEAVKQKWRADSQWLTAEYNKVKKA
jgi:hypothetical protein